MTSFRSVTSSFTKESMSIKSMKLHIETCHETKMNYRSCRPGLGELFAAELCTTTTDRRCSCLGSLDLHHLHLGLLLLLGLLLGMPLLKNREKTILKQC